MFSKTAHSPASRSTTGPGHPLSIAVRLTLWHATCGFLLLAAATILLYWTLAHGLDRDDDQFLSERMGVLERMLVGGVGTPSAVAAEIARESIGGGSSRLHVRLLRTDGSVIGETVGMAEVLPVGLFPGTRVPAPARIEPFDVASPSGHPFRAVAIDAGNATIIQIALDRSGEAALLKTYRNRMGVILLVGLLLFSLSAWYVTRRAMRPIRELTEVVRRIEASRLQLRLGIGDWPGELSELARSFDAMLGRLEHGFQTLERFSENIAHELRTPLGILRGEAEVVLMHGRTPQEYREVLESSLEEYARLGGLVDSLLFLARAEHATGPIDCRRLDIGAEALAVCEAYEALAAVHGITIQAHGNAEIAVDPILLRRALANLVSNALRYTPPGGTVRISVEPASATAVAVRVSDTGRGIDPAHLPHVFERFYRADAARTREGEGFGLGLAIVRSIVTLHGGAVAIASEPGCGTVVTLTFP